MRTTWAERVTRAEGIASDLRGRFGIERADPVGCLLDNSVEAIDAVLGIWLAGAIVLSLPPRARGMTAVEHGRQLRTLIAHARTRLVLAPAHQLDGISGELPARCAEYGSLESSSRYADPLPAEEVCFVQYSSGATGEPKGCALTEAAIASQLAALGAALELSSKDRFVSWLPLAHDMGFFGTFMLPWWHELPARLSSPQRFVASPRSWLADCAAYGATITAAPNFALDVATRSATGRDLPGRLVLRALVVGAEQIRWESLVRMGEALSAAGLPFECLTPAYGLAEATLAVTVSPLETPASSITVNRRRLRSLDLEAVSDEDPASDRYVGVGVPLPGTAVQIEGGDVGQVLVSSPSQAHGYFRAPTLTESRFVDGMIRTGDLGFIHDGELYIVGRMDDVLVVGGRNVSAREIEAAIAERLGLRSGGVAVVPGGDSGARRVVALLEHSPGPQRAARAFAAAADDAAIARTGVGIDECIFLEPGTMPRSPSGKLQRQRASAIAEGEEEASREIRRDSVVLRKG